MNCSAKRIIVIGAASGIGAAACQLLVKAGWQVAAVDRETVRLDRDPIVTIKADVRDREEFTSGLLHCVDALGGVDAVWSNVGIQFNGDVEHATYEQFDTSWQTNVMSHVIVAKTLIPHLRADGGGVLLLTASNAGLQAESNLVAYSVTKAATVQLGRVLAKDHAKDGVRVNILCPGYVDTPFNAPVWQNFGGRERFLSEIAREIPLGRMATPEEIAIHVRFLLSDEASFLTGQVFAPDGGELL